MEHNKIVIKRKIITNQVFVYRGDEVLDKVLLGVGVALVALGIGFLAVASRMQAIRHPFVLGGLLWSVVGSITIIIGRSVNRKKRKQLGAQIK